ncbi:MAG: pilus assembly protein PilM, partial [Acidobacteria bacterium]|nr:pilus assembly protein PilM [Acidobacteriota bacterium]
ARAGGDAVVLAHAGAGSVTVVVVRAGRPEVFRNSPLAPYLHSGRGEEPGPGKDGAFGKGGPDAAPTRAASAAAQVAREVERAMEDCRADVDADPIDRLVVSGGWACAPGFAGMLEDRVAVPVVRLEPFRGLAAAGRADDDLLAGDAPAAAVAVGLALRRSDER